METPRADTELPPLLPLLGLHCSRAELFSCRLGATPPQGSASAAPSGSLIGLTASAFEQRVSGLGFNGSIMQPVGVFSDSEMKAHGGIASPSCVR